MPTFLEALAASPMPDEERKLLEQIISRVERGEISALALNTLLAFLVGYGCGRNGIGEKVQSAITATLLIA